MSTEYYRLREPVSSIRLEEGATHDRFSVWQGGALAGVLCVQAGEGRKFVRIFADRDFGPIMYTYWGGNKLGSVVVEVCVNVSDDCQLVSEYGEVLTAGEVRARQGARRRDGMPTELFGYEKEAAPRSPSAPGSEAKVAWREGGLLTCPCCCRKLRLGPCVDSIADVTTNESLQIAHEKETGP